MVYLTEEPRLDSYLGLGAVLVRFSRILTPSYYLLGTGSEIMRVIRIVFPASLGL